MKASSIEIGDGNDTDEEKSGTDDEENLGMIKESKYEKAANQKKGLFGKGKEKYQGYVTFQKNVSLASLDMSESDANAV